MASATESPGEGGATAPEAATAVVERPAASDDEKARRRAESQERAKLMAQLSADVKMRVATREITLPQALAEAGLEIPEWLRTGASAPPDAPAPPGDVEPSLTGVDPHSEVKPELDAQKAEAAAEGRELVGGAPGPDTQPVAPRTVEDATPASVSPPADPKEAKRAEAQRKLALMQRLPSELKLRVAKREISLEDAMREAGVGAGMSTKIALDGVGGQGVRLIAGVMGALLARMGKEVTVLFDYDSSVRGSMSDAFLIFDDEPIANPVVEEADIMLKLADKGHLRISGRKVVADLGLDVPGAEQIPFASLGSQLFGKELFGNMIALGRILRLAHIDWDEPAIRESLPRRYVEENVAAIRYGYDLTDEEIARLAAAAPPSRFQMNTAATAETHERTVSAGHGVAAGTPLDE